ncbi:hypothetical protein [Rubritalea tangerina]|uniref:hypothetical protein n=1 Tax=Rubritalea tangerina TaxID=430798 RepID=UPI003610B167
MGIRIREFFYKLTLPIRSVWSFLQAWAESRSYKSCLIASPVLIGALVGFTVYFINANKKRVRHLMDNTRVHWRRWGRGTISS